MAPTDGPSWGTLPSRVATLAGASGCVAFVATWALAGQATPGYSPVHDPISRLAAAGAPHQAVMTTAIVGYGVGLVTFGIGGLRRARAGRAWATVAVSGLCTLGVAATPLGSPTRDAAHHAFAAVGYATLAATPLLAGAAWAARGRARAAGWSRLAGAACAVALAASTLSPASGALQRTGLTIGDAWVVVVAAVLIRGPRSRPRRASVARPGSHRRDPSR